MQTELRSSTVGVNRWYVYLLAFVAAVGGFVFGYDVMIMSSAILYLKEYFALTPAQEGFAMTSAVYGIFIGLFFAGPASDRLGRKKTLVLAAILFGVSAIGTALPKTFLVWNIFRIVGGVGCGLASVVSPLYISEISPAHLRGRLVSMNQIAIVLSVLTAAVVAYFLAPIEHQWRWMFSSVIPLTLVLAAGLLFIPESPRWLIQNGREDAAERIIARISGCEAAGREVLEVRAALTQESGTWGELFSPGVRMALIIAVFVAAFQQLTGASTVIFYAPTIFKQAGIAANASAIANTIILSVFNIVFTVVAICLVDKLGRRPLLLLGAVGMAVGQILLGILFYLHLPPQLALVFMIVAVGAYVMSFAPLGWLIMSEVFPTRIRARAMALATVVLQLSSLAANGFFPVVRNYSEKTFGSAGPTFWVFAAVCICAFVFCYKYVPETRGKTLEEISAFWKKPQADGGEK